MSTKEEQGRGQVAGADAPRLHWLWVTWLAVGGLVALCVHQPVQPVGQRGRRLVRGMHGRPSHPPACPIRP